MSTAYDAAGRAHDLPVATENIVVTDGVGVGRQIRAGQPVPLHLVAAYNEARGEAGEAKAADDSAIEELKVALDERDAAIAERDEALERLAEIEAAGAADAPEPAADAPEPYDPGAHTVVEVLDHLAEHPDEVDAIKAAEADGQARAGIRDYTPKED